MAIMFSVDAAHYTTLHGLSSGCNYSTILGETRIKLEVVCEHNGLKHAGTMWYTLADIIIVLVGLSRNPVGYF